MNNPDVSLGDTPENPPQDAQEPHQPPISPSVMESLASAAVKPLSISELLEHGRRVERTVPICIRGDLQAEYDRVIAELGKLVTPSGQLLEEASMAPDGDEAASVAQALYEELEGIRAQMVEWTRSVRVRAMPADEWPAWDKAHRPKDSEADFTDYNVAIIAECAVSPTLTQDEARTMFKSLGHPTMLKVANAAYSANTQSGIDIPKSLGSWESHNQK